MFSTSPVFVSCCLCIALLYFSSYRRRRRANPQNLPLPPGPPPLPFIGNVHQTPKHHDWIRYFDWAQKYGQLVHFRLFRQPVIILNTHKAAVDLFEKRSAIYSDRPKSFIMAAELMGWDQGVALRPSGPRHRKYRKLLSTALNPVAARKLWPLQEIGTQKFLNRLADNPDHFYDHIRASVSETIVMVAFGHECSKDDFPYIDMAESSHQNFTIAASPYAYAVDFLPMLRYLPEWFPGAKFKRQARAWNAELQELVHYPYRTVKADLNNGTARPSYVASHIDTDEPLSSEDEEDIMWSAASLYTGGVDTTTAAVTTFMLAMCLYPEVQLKAQRELDSVVGADRLPTASDRENLPYINACLQEVLRWYPIAPLGLSHRAMQADHYEGYYIPEGATVISNIWAMTHDPSIYRDPDEFQPERFLPSRGVEVTGAVDAMMTFGFGRRICPGMHMADSSLFLYMARTLATFNIAKATDPNGRQIEPEVEFVSGLITHPKPFKCSITVRSGGALQLVRSG